MSSKGNPARDTLRNMKTQTSKADLLIAITNLYLAAVGYRGRSSGEVYSMVMSNGVTLDNHNAIVRALCGGGVMREDGHFLTLTTLGAELFAKVAAQVRSETLVNA